MGKTEKNGGHAEAEKFRFLKKPIRQDQEDRFDSMFAHDLSEAMTDFMKELRNDVDYFAPDKYMDIECFLRETTESLGVPKDEMKMLFDIFKRHPDFISAEELFEDYAEYRVAQSAVKLHGVKKEVLLESVRDLQSELGPEDGLKLAKFVCKFVDRKIDTVLGKGIVG